MLSQLYKGFVIDEALGNNAFSFNQRQNKSIYVPALLQAGLDHLKAGSRICFSEVCEGIEKNVIGLDCFLQWKYADKPVFIFDNHNHAFCFWVWAYQNGHIDMQASLVHVDQHKDMREPEFYLETQDLNNLEKVFWYTNEVLNVGNFIQPVLSVGLIDDIYMIDHRAAFEATMPEQYILDIDMDIFSDDMSYINDSYKLEMIRTFIERASIITVATSPYFIEQEKAIHFVRKLFEGR